MKQPPPLPSRHDFVGAAALALGVICAGSTAASIYLWREVGQYRAGLPAYATEGAVGFSLQIIPWCLTLCSIGLGLLAGALWGVSFSVRRSERQLQITFIDIATAVALLPLCYLLARFATVFLW